MANVIFRKNWYSGDRRYRRGSQPQEVPDELVSVLPSSCEIVADEDMPAETVEAEPATDWRTEVDTDRASEDEAEALRQRALKFQQELEDEREQRHAEQTLANRQASMARTREIGRAKEAAGTSKRRGRPPKTKPQE